MATYRLTHPIVRTGQKLVLVPPAPVPAGPAPLHAEFLGASWSARIVGLLPFASAACVVLFLAAGTASAVREQRSFDRFKSDVALVEVRAPNSFPAQNQESIDVAAELFSIDIPLTVAGPYFDAHLEDRGLTTGGTLSAEKNVTIGPAAFTSWSVLGSTLGHEIEVHVRQSFLKVVLLDKLTHAKLEARKLVGRVFPAAKPSVRQLFEEGTWSAEREAYLF